MVRCRCDDCAAHDRRDRATMRFESNRRRRSHVARCRSDRRPPPDAAQADVLARRRGAGRHRRGGGRRRCCSPATRRLAGGAGRLDRAGHHRGPDPRQPQRVEALERLGQVERQGGDRAHQQPGRHRRRLRGAPRLADASSRRKKPMVVVVDGLAASGGYIAAMASDHIIAQQSSHGRLDRRASSSIRTSPSC